MLFFYPMDLTHGMGRFSNKLKKMGEFLTIDHNATISNKFFEYCQNYDCENVDKMLEKAFQSFLGYDNILTGLNELADKFPELNIDISSAISEKEKVLLLAEYADKMLEIIPGTYKKNEREEWAYRISSACGRLYSSRFWKNNDLNKFREIKRANEECRDTVVFVKGKESIIGSKSLFNN